MIIQLAYYNLLLGTLTKDQTETLLWIFKKKKQKENLHRWYPNLCFNQSISWWRKITFNQEKLLRDWKCYMLFRIKTQKTFYAKLLSRQLISFGQVSSTLIKFQRKFKKKDAKDQFLDWHSILRRSWLITLERKKHQKNREFSLVEPWFHFATSQVYPES